MVEILRLHKKTLNVNGSQRTVLVSDQDSLADVIRQQLGLWGTKVGCRLNQCGICSVILNDKLVRSCMVKMAKVEDGAKLLTIEGIGTPEHLHPLQAAWVKYGGAQCGFCTPGFIVSAYALLQENPAPTREQVRAWFQKNRNACRCTGYKVLVDAVMAAAAVLRGEQPEESLYFSLGEDGRIFGTAYPRPSAVAKVTGTYEYGADTGLFLPRETLRLALVQAKVSHANILRIDTSEAEKMPGVAAVITHKDVKGNNRINGFVLYPWNKGDGFDRPILNDEKIFQYGDALAIVCADTQAHADAAAAMVKVEVEELPAYMNAREAVAEDAVEIHPGTPNKFFEQNLAKGEDSKALLENSYLVLEREYYTQRQPHLVMEPDVGYGYYDDTGRLTIHSKSVGVYCHADMIAEGLGLKPEEVRMIQNNAGGTFGYKLSPTLEALIGVAVMHTGRPCYLEFTMHQQLTYTGKRSPFFSKIRLGCDRDGKLTAMENEVLADHGAYSEFGDLLLVKNIEFTCAGYHLNSMRGKNAITFTNHAYGAAMRAYGSPQAFFAGESIIDELARAYGMDPFEFRYQNVYNEDSTTPTGCSPDVVVIRGLLDKLRPAYQQAQAVKAAFPAGKIKRGVGVSLGIYSCGDDGYDNSEAAVELQPDGKIAVYLTWEDHGQGGDMGALVSVHEAFRQLGYPKAAEDFIIINNDTGRCPNSGYAAGSRSQLMVGNAIWDAAENLIRAMRKEDGSFRTYEEMMAEDLPLYYLGVYNTSPYVSATDEQGTQGNPFVAYMYAAFVSEVEVDTETGTTKVKKITAAYDVGRIANRLVVEGQAYGGLAQGIGMALSEDFEDLKAHTTLVKSGLPYIEDVPDDITLIFQETPRKHSKFGCAGVGEAVTTAPHVSIINAIDDACGARIRRLPAYPEKVLQALKDKEREQNQQ